MSVFHGSGLVEAIDPTAATNAKAVETSQPFRTIDAHAPLPFPP